MDSEGGKWMAEDEVTGARRGESEVVRLVPFGLWTRVAPRNRV